MKKSFFFSLALSVFGIGMLAMSASAIEVTTTAIAVAEGELIKGDSYQTVYYLAEDGKRYVFPNSKTYFSWFDDFIEVREIPDEELFSYPLGGNVRYKPGSLLVKITTNPKVYAVGENGKLRWVKDEAMAVSLYGENWNKLVDDIPDSFFVNYELGEDADEEFNPTEIEEEYPSISHNRGFKVKENIQNRAGNRVERRCNILEDAVNKLQKRIEMYGIEVDGLGNDFASECVEGGLKHLNKVQVCHRSAEGQYKTLEVAPAALRGMLAKRAMLGDCLENGIEEAVEEEEEEELECEDGEEVQEVDGIDQCVAVEEEEENELECPEGEEVGEVDGVEQCVAIEEEELECVEGEEIQEVDGVDQCVAVEEEVLECEEGEEVGEVDGVEQCVAIEEEELECAEGEEVQEVDGVDQCVVIE